MRYRKWNRWYLCLSKGKQVKEFRPLTHQCGVSGKIAKFMTKEKEIFGLLLEGCDEKIRYSTWIHDSPLHTRIQTAAKTVERSRLFSAKEDKVGSISRKVYGIGVLGC